MLQHITIQLGLIILLLLHTGCQKTTSGNQEDETPVKGARIITFSGHQWEVRSSSGKAAGPGPNFFSDSEDNVWLDNNGRLHLRITMRNGQWYCAGIKLLKSYTYGRYLFELDSRVDTLDKNVVNGLFIYENDDQEVDIEFSKWSVDQNMDAQFVVQPGDKSGNKKKFFLNHADHQSVHWIDWFPDQIAFASFRGLLRDTAKAGNMIQKWAYSGDDLPVDRDESVKLNLWLFKGLPPANRKETEVIVSGFRIIEKK
ncbi:hypothetical protein U0035_21810 [Niabella yanshanensis]|uniref:GH16 domain-containing protein n=1 Tax=Niabella yanshanensis TaxID=577386 RepID=A0ABZ0W9V3_9BACT|nr:hypothetical protein [Niabella yanshanensis]WQD38312.1 hypothetical protein U0035_21810 [Niabella yanshanensis]